MHKANASSCEILPYLFAKKFIHETMLFTKQCLNTQALCLQNFPQTA